MYVTIYSVLPEWLSTHGLGIQIRPVKGHGSGSITVLQLQAAHMPTGRYLNHVMMIRIVRGSMKMDRGMMIHATKRNDRIFADSVSRNYSCRNPMDKGIVT